MALSEKCKLDSWVDRMLPTLRVDEENIIPLESIDCVQVIKQSKKLNNPIGTCNAYKTCEAVVIKPV